ncbi:MAG: hypothetical protein GEU68_09935 [Actinobacteria bacterium]|nr:hypothetical protein [Actinomycetota bacterium]
MNERMLKPLICPVCTALSRALRRGYRVLQREGDSTDAVEDAITSMEDSPLFNAGKGAVFTTDAANELDASIDVARCPLSGHKNSTNGKRASKRGPATKFPPRRRRF